MTSLNAPPAAVMAALVPVTKLSHDLLHALLPLLGAGNSLRLSFEDLVCTVDELMLIP
jgi:hypothetical protein